MIKCDVIPQCNDSTEAPEVDVRIAFSACHLQVAVVLQSGFSGTRCSGTTAANAKSKTQGVTMSHSG